MLLVRLCMGFRLGLRHNEHKVSAATLMPVECGVWWTDSMLGKLVSVTLCIPQIPHGLLRDDSESEWCGMASRRC